MRVADLFVMDRYQTAPGGWLSGGANGAQAARQQKQQAAEAARMAALDRMILGGSDPPAMPDMNAGGFV